MARNGLRPPAPPVTARHFAFTTVAPSGVDRGITLREYFLKAGSRDLTSSDDSVRIWRDERGVSRCDVNQIEVPPEKVLSSCMIGFLAKRVFAHTAIVEARVSRRELELVAAEPTKQWRLIDRHVLEGINLLNGVAAEAA